jgi:hypothetical protein
MSQAAPGFLLHLRLFLEGIEVPVISASVTATIGSGATATVEIIPDDTVDQILPRTTVHIFYLDSFAYSQSGASEPKSAHYKLMFAGEVFSVSSQKAGMGSRSVNLNCMDFSNCLDTNYVYQFQPARDDTANNSIVRNTSRFLTTLDSTFDSIISSPSAVIQQLTNQSPITPGLSGGQTTLLGGLFAILEKLLGVQGNSYGTNGWTTVQERRTRFIESIVSDSGETAANVYKAKEFSGWLNGRIAQEGQVIAFRRLVDIICEFIFYQIVPNPVAKYVRGNSTKFPGYPNRDVPVVATAPVAGDDTGFSRFAGNSRGTTVANLQADFAKDVLGLLTAVDDELGNKKLVSGLSAKIRINRGWVNSNKSNAQSLHLKGLAVDARFDYTDSRANQIASSPNMGVIFMPNYGHATKGKAKPIPHPGSWYHNFFNAVVEKKIPQNTPLDAIKTIILNDRALFARYWQSSPGKLDKDIVVAKDWLSFAGIMRRLAGQYGLQVMHKMASSVFDPFLEGILGIGDDPVHIQYLSGRDTTPIIQPTPIEEISEDPEAASVSSPRERLHSFVFRPDIWFVAPPKSNVIFPDALQSFSTQREMMRETTRLQLDVAFDLAAESAVNTPAFFAPQIVGQESLTTNGLADASKILIYDHEKYSGIVPKFERMLDTMFHMEQEPGTAGPTTGPTAGEQRGEIEAFASIIAHFHLLSQRFQARSASVSMAFSPHIICGFPAVVMDTIITADEIKNKELSLNRSFKLGMVQSVSHSLSQGGGQTQVRLSHVRSHRTGDKTDDLFTKGVNSDGEVTLGVQDVENIGLSAGIQTFGCIADKGWGDSQADSEYGFKAIAAVFGFSSIEELILQAREYPVTSTSPVDWRTITDGPNSADATEKSTTVSFSETSLRGKVVKGGAWSGSPIAVYIRVIGDPRGLNSASVASGVRIIADTKPSSSITDDQSYEESPSITRFITSNVAVVPPAAEESESIIPLILPGSVFTPEIDGSTTGALPLPVEESIRPRWISDDYSSTNITDKIYRPLFGTKSITDGIPGGSYSVTSVEEAVDSLASIYSKEVVSSGQDLLPTPLLWIYEYTHRDVATMPEILGTKAYDDVARKSVVIDPNIEKIKYLGGFHSNAVNFGSDKYGKELAFLDIKGAGLTHGGTSSGNEEPFSLEGAEGDRMDPRAERAKRVLQYKKAIRGDESLRGGATTSAGIGKRG